jgi:hypothetical protein
VQLGLVGELGRVASHEEELHDVGEDEVVVGVVVVEQLVQPAPVEQQVLEHEGEGLGDGVVAEVAILERQERRSVREVLGVPRLVQQRGVVVGAALRQHHEVDLVGHADGTAEGARRLELAHLGVEMDVGLRGEVDAEPGERTLEASAAAGRR